MTTSELLDRYVHAVGFWLPKKQKADIMAELSEDMRSQIEEKEAEVGRKLALPEVECILKMRGRPVLVANHYLPQQYLIGPLLFPIYRFVLMIVGLCYLVPWIVVSIVLMSYSSAYRQDGWFKGLLTIWGSFWGTAFLAVGIVTLVFAVLERVNSRTHFLEEWEPRDLPAVRDPNRIPRGSSLFELAALLAFCVWWFGYMWSPVIINRPDVRIVLSPQWKYFFWGFGLLSLANLGMSSVNLARPYWTRLRAGLRLIIDLAGSALVAWVLKAHMLTEITAANVPATRTTQITNAINLWADRAFPIAVVVGVTIAVFNVYRIVRVKTNSPSLTQQAAAMLN